MAKTWTAREIRESYLQFFTERQHRRVPSSPIVPLDDPTLLFTSAGMVQFKPLYRATGELEYRRATSVQKCFRATDLEQVGRTPRHLCFFEMLGNFSFGDYFKKEAIAWAWEYVTEVLRIDLDRLWVTVHLGDDEAEAIWRDEVGVIPERIVRLGDDDNFWGPAGTSGACGPSSEIFWDLGPGFGCGAADCKPGCECDRFQEIWNLVFPQFDQAEDGTRTPLPRPGIDTGMGLERLAMLLQGTDSVFEIDGFGPIRDALAEMVEFDVSDAEQQLSVNVILEHARAVTMLFNEGVYPGNEGRSYVARRILRRAVRRGRLLGLHEPFLYRLTGVAVDTLADAYPELVESRERIAKVCRAEETRFLETLETGMRRFDEVVERTRAEGGTEIAGGDVFTLYDTFGFPRDMTAEMAREKGMTLDEAGFESAMKEQQERSRASARFEQEKDDTPWEWLGDEDAPHSEYLGYDHLHLDVRPVARRRKGTDWEILLDRTPFYAEGGGQVADRGRLVAEDSVLEIVDVRRKGALHVHTVSVAEGAEPTGQLYRASVDAVARRSTERNHTATHLLHAALRRVLGTHVTQQGSLVAPDRLRFDFSHFSPLTPAQIQAVEEDVNRAVLADYPVAKEVTAMEEARSSGAIAMFGEKYGDRVRQVYVMDEDASDVTRELCGGCHVRRTGEIGLFRIVAEESVAAGVRRVEAATGWNALHHAQREDDLLHRIGETVKAGSLTDVEARVRALADEHDRLKRELAKLQSATLQQAAGELSDRARDVEGVAFVAEEIPADGVDGLREAADKLRDRMKSGAGVLAARSGDKASFLAFVTDDLVKERGLRADVLVREVAKVAGGGGGGRPNLATAGAKQPETIGEALAAAEAILRDQLSARA